jgi:hypothetical protein
MIKLLRDPVSIVMTEVLWNALQELARGEGWHPAGALDLRDRCIHSTYTPGRGVAGCDARAFANALERLVNASPATGSMDSVRRRTDEPDCNTTQAGGLGLARPAPPASQR